MKKKWSGLPTIVITFCLIVGFTSDFFQMKLRSMTFVIIARQIDLSVASIIAVSSCVLGYTTSVGFDTYLVISFTLISGILCGAFNGFIITRFAIPSIIVTIGTMSLFRGLAYSSLEDQYYNKFPKFVKWLDFHQSMALIKFLYIF